MKLSIIIPIYNETASLIELITRIESVAVEKEIVIVDDGSTLNATHKLLEQCAGRNNVTIIKHEENQGKGAALCTGLSHATGNMVIFQDADSEYHPEDYPNLIDTYEKNNAKAVYGVRDLSKRSWYMLLGNRFLTLVTNIIYHGKLHDMETCYKLVDREVLLSLDLESKRFEIEAEISAKLLRQGVQVFECPIQYSERREGKKLTPLDGFPAIYTLLKFAYWVRPLPESKATLDLK